MLKRTVAGLIVAVAIANGAIAGMWDDILASVQSGDITPPPETEIFIADVYASGIGEPQDYTKAAKWYRLAGEQGLARAQYNLGLIYAKGKGVPQDNVQALMWLNLAVAEDNKLFSDDRDSVAKLMTSAQIAEAERLVREWKPTKAH